MADLCQFQFVPVKTFGTSGQGAGQFDQPSHVAVNDEMNEVAVTDRINCRVQVFGRDGNYLRQFRGKGSEQGMFRDPSGIAFDGQNNIIVGDYINRNVSVFYKDGRFLRYLATGGNEDGQVIDPQGISVSDEGNIIVCDRGNKRIQVFSPDGEMIFKFSDDGDDERREVDNPKACVYYKDHYRVAVFFNRFSSSITLYDKNGQFVRRFRDVTKVCKRISGLMIWP